MREVESDMSRFHRVNDTDTYPDGGRWVMLAEQLPVYDGAVARAALRERQQAENAPIAVTHDYLMTNPDLAGMVSHG